jgi:GGDEF domain-containing protein
MRIEENIIRNSKEVLKKIIDKSIEQNIVEDEYKKLLNSYKKLFKRSTRISRMSDRKEKDTIVKNESLKTDKKNIQKSVREKMMSSAKAQREKQEQYGKELLDDKQAINNLKNKLKDVTMNYNLSLQKIEKLIDKKIVHKEDVSKKIDYYKNINLEKFRKFTYKEILNKVISDTNKNDENLVIIKLTVDNLSNNNSEISAGVLSAIFKSINGSLKNKDIIYFTYPDIFYILLLNKNIEQSQSMLELITKSRDINKTGIKFSLGVTQYKKGIDNYDYIENRISLGNEEAKKILDENSLVIK